MQSNGGVTVTPQDCERFEGFGPTDKFSEIDVVDSPGALLRTALMERAPVIAAGVIDGLFAHLTWRAGCAVVYASGSATSRAMVLSSGEWKSLFGSALSVGFRVDASGGLAAPVLRRKFLKNSQRLSD